MKRIHIYITILSATLLFSSCSDWLDVQPSTDKDRAELIESADGYKKMLYGTYINLTSTSLYGANLTFGFVSSLERDYITNLSDVGSGWSAIHYSFDDTGIRGTYIDPVWSKMYNNIANVNSILADISEHKSLFRPSEYGLVAGEAYAERAMMHFDLLRMFAPNYVNNEEAIAIPYITTYEAARHEHLKAREVMKLVIEDLDKAESLMKEANDPLISNLQTITYNGAGEFTANRQYHLNYWAAIALKARAYLYMGDTTNALKYAKMVIDQAPFTWVSETQIAGGDKVFQSELITGLEVADLPNLYDSYFESQLFILSEEGFWGAADQVHTLKIFEDANDYRYLYLFKKDGRGNDLALSSKYEQEVGSSKAMKKQTVPLIRLGEMYLIAAECMAESNPAEAIKLLRDLKKHRGYYAADAGVADGSTADAIKTYVKNEMRKETYAEGQFWFFLKRTNSPVPDFGWQGSIVLAPEKFVYPMPEAEKEYGYIPSTETGENDKTN